MARGENWDVFLTKSVDATLGNAYYDRRDFHFQEGLTVERFLSAAVKTVFVVFASAPLGCSPGKAKAALVVVAQTARPLPLGGAGKGPESCGGAHSRDDERIFGNLSATVLNHLFFSDPTTNALYD